MADGYENHAPENLQGKYQAMVVCCILGIGSLFSWNSMLTIADYYYQVFPDYHPSRVFTLIYQPIALGTIMILAYRESKISTRKRILTGYILFTISTFLLIVLDLTTKGHGGIGHYIVLCTIVASFGLADATVKGGLVGDLSLMCPELIQSYMAGSGMAGALTSVLRLITKAAFEKSNNSLRKGASEFSILIPNPTFSKCLKFHFLLCLCFPCYSDILSNLNLHRTTLRDFICICVPKTPHR
jgi:equilibrative nucleoside transporter 1/2/3